MTAVKGHLAAPAALSGVVLPTLESGLLLGRNRRNQPVAVRAFGPQPTLITLLGGIWLARIVTFRAMALGARLAVHPSAAPSWHGFAEAATGNRDRTTVIEPEGLATLAGTQNRPVWYVCDVAAPPSGPWQTVLSVLPQLTVGSARSLIDANLVVARTLTPPEAALTVTALRLHASQADHLQMISGDMVAVFGSGSYPYLRLGPTALEQHLFGPPARE